MFNRWLLLLFVTAGILQAQTFGKITFEGLHYLSPKSAKAIMRINEGQEIDDEELDEALDRLRQQGYFEKVEAKKNGDELIIKVVEKRSIANIEIEGISNKDEKKAMLEHLGIKKGDIYDETKIEEAKHRILEMLEAKGYYDSIVEVKTKPSGTSGIEATFNVIKGEKITIEKVKFIGAKKVPKSKLLAPLANKEPGIFKWIPIVGKEYADVNQLQYDAYRVKEVYLKYGYLDALISDPLMRTDLGAHKADITYLVKEGGQYRAGEILIESNIEDIDTKKLLKKLSLKKGQIFDIEKMRRDLAMIKEIVGNYGYAFAQVIPQMQKDDQNHIISLRFVINPGNKVTINDVIISGNKETTDRVIRRYLYLAPGDLYNATDLKDSRLALSRTGFFEKVEIFEERVDDDKLNLLVKVKEAPTGSIMVGGGYSSYEKAIFNASVSDKNFLGSGISASLGVEYSKIKKYFSISFTNPRVFDTRNSLSLSLYNKEYEYPTYIVDTKGANLMLGREFGRRLHLSVGAGYVDNDSRPNNNPELTAIYGDNNLSLLDPIGFYQDRYKKSSLFASARYDSTDHYFVPRSGIYSTFDMEFASLDGDDVNLSAYPGGYGKFTKLSTKFGYYYGLEDHIGYDLILRFKARATVISSNEDEKLPIAEKLFMGGTGTLRGYDPYSLSPGSDQSFYGTGGKKRASVSLEASVPFMDTENMRVAAFYDYGMIGEDSFDEVKRQSTGLVLEWLSPFGPINLIFAKPIDEKPFDRTSSFEFTMGRKF